jgi:hypothetical protein
VILVTHDTRRVCRQDEARSTAKVARDAARCSGTLAIGKELRISRGDGDLSALLSRS